MRLLAELGLPMGTGAVVGGVMGAASPSSFWADEDRLRGALHGMLGGAAVGAGAKGLEKMLFRPSFDWDRAISFQGRRIA
jgi:hypothetical protein